MNDNPLGIVDIDALVDNIPAPRFSDDAPAAPSKEKPSVESRRTKMTQSKVTESGDVIWEDFLRYAREYSEISMSRTTMRVGIHPELIETLKLVKGYDYRDLINAAVKVFIMSHKDQLRRNMLPKPKILL